MSSKREVTVVVLLSGVKIVENIQPGAKIAYTHPECDIYLKRESNLVSLAGRSANIDAFVCRWVSQEYPKTLLRLVRVPPRKK